MYIKLTPTLMKMNCKIIKKGGGEGVRYGSLQNGFEGRK